MSLIESFDLPPIQKKPFQSNRNNQEGTDDSKSKYKKWEEYEQEFEYIVILSYLEAPPAQKERRTQQLNLVKQQMEIAKNKLIFYYSLDFTTGLLAWPLALVSGILFVFLSQDRFEEIFKPNTTGAEIPGTFFADNRE